MRETDDLFSIAIPTFNRAEYLDVCLCYIAKQTESMTDKVKIIICDNCSTDNTQMVVNKWISSGLQITYHRNSANIGSDKNYIQCFNKAISKYVLILSDDDILLPGALKMLIKLLRSGDFGVVHLNAFPFLKNPIKERPIKPKNYIKIYSDFNEFIKKIGVYSTSISMNVINRELVPSSINIEDFIGSNLIQLAYILGAITYSKKNAYINMFCVAILIYNSSGYKLSKVFGENLNRVFEKFFMRGVSKEALNVLKRKMLISFYPANIIRGRNNLTMLQPEDYYMRLYPLYHKHLYFWIFVVPAIILPKKIAYLIFNIVDKLRKKVPFVFSFLRG